MWEVATQKLGLSPVFAGFGFFLFEAMMATAMIRAERSQARTGRPGRHGRAVWLIAVVAGLIAAVAGDSVVEMGLRLAVPLLVAYQWWVGLSDDGAVRAPDAITWTWTPRRLLVAVGLARPGVSDLSTVDRERQVRAVAKVAHRLHSTRWVWRRAWCQMRLRSLAMRSDDAVLDAARARVERVWRAAERTRPATPAELEAVASARAEAEAARAEAERFRTDAELARADLHRLRAEVVRVRDHADRVQAEAGRVRAEAEATAAEAVEAARAEAEAMAAEAERSRAELEAVRAELAASPAGARRLARHSSQSQRAVQVFEDGDSVPHVPRVGAATVRAVLEARRAEPSATQKEIAARVQVSDRTVRAVLAAVSNGRAGDRGTVGGPSAA
jgi:hypothetical protein